MNGICARCGHTRAEHCKGHISHTEWKDDRGQGLKHQRSGICTGPHCNEALCSCVSFVNYYLTPLERND